MLTLMMGNSRLLTWLNSIQAFETQIICKVSFRASDYIKIRKFNFRNNNLNNNSHFNVIV